MSERKNVLVCVGVLLLVVVVVYMIVGGRPGFHVNLGNCEPAVSRSSVACGRSAVAGYFLFPKTIEDIKKAYEPSTRSIVIYTLETKPVGCYRAFEINWQDLDVQRVVFVIELNGKQVGRTVLDVNACIFLGR